VPEIPLPDPPLADESVLLRPYRREDTSALAAACGDPEIPRWTTIPSPYTEGDAREFVSRCEGDRKTGRELALAIVEPGDGALLGGCGLARFDWVERRVEIGYWVAREQRRRSIGTRAVGLLSRWTLTSLGMERVELLTDPANEASIGLAERAGFKREGLLRSYRRRGTGRWDLVMHSLLASDL
jgi:RimJ/RimL family protein N-acetyltransferase